MALARLPKYLNTHTRHEIWALPFINLHHVSKYISRDLTTQDLRLKSNNKICPIQNKLYILAIKKIMGGIKEGRVKIYVLSIQLSDHK